MCSQRRPSPNNDPAMEIDTLIHARWVIPVHPIDAVLQHHSIAITAGRIIEILPSESASRKYTARSNVDCPTHAIIPGLINSHTHAAMNLLKGLADDLPLMHWLHEHIWPAEAKWLSEDFVRDGTQLAIAEMLRSGTTTFNDMYLFPDIALRSVQQSGIRASLGMVVLDFPTPWAQDADEYIGKGLALYDEVKTEPLIKMSFAPHAPYTVSDPALSRIATLSNELECPIHIHVHETAQEVSDAVASMGQRPLQRLDRLGLITPNLQAVHATQLNAEEIQLLSERGANVIHCPESNQKLASGTCPVPQLLEAGINVALGTDSCASNNDLNMLGEMRSAALLAKGSTGDASRLPAHQVLQMATLNGARALGIDDVTGSLEPGKCADLVAINLETIETQPVYDPLSSLIYATSREAVEHVWVAGKQLLNQRRLTTLNETELLQSAHHWQAKIASTDQEQQA